MKIQITSEVTEQRIENELLQIVELEDRLELAALEAGCCEHRCSGNDYPDTIAL